MLIASVYREKYGALYSDLKDVKPALLTTLFHNLRLFLLIPLLVLLSGYPLAQSVTYLVSAVAGFAWDFALLPFEGRLLTAEALFMDVSKIGAAAGYVLLTAPGISLAAAEWTETYEFYMFIGSIGGGAALAILETLAGVAEAVREWFQTKKLKNKIVPVGDTSVVDFSFQRTSQGSVVTHAN